VLPEGSTGITHWLNSVLKLVATERPAAKRPVAVERPAATERPVAAERPVAVEAKPSVFFKYAFSAVSKISTEPALAKAFVSKELSVFELVKSLAVPKIKKEFILKLAVTKTCLLGECGFCKCC